MMTMFLKSIAFILAGCLCALASGAQGRVEAAVTNAKNDKGVCRACLFSSAEAFRENKPFRCVSVPLSGKKASVTFEQVPDGEYAVLVFHDANNNNKMDKNFLGIPSEGYGASKNNLPFAGAPTFEGNRFPVKGGAVRLGIRLRNL
jgi:uncharacterized protein (DUF2141 family)